MLTTAPIPKLIGKLAVPSIISMLITAIYNMADAMFVGRISTQATAAVGIVFSYMALVQAVGFFFGHGSANYISRALGAKDSQGAQKIAAVGFFTTVLLGVAFTILGLVFMTPLLRFFGATAAIMEDTKSYFFFVLLATPFIAGSFVLNNQMRMQGAAALGTIGMASGAILNIILDPVFIFGLDMGVMGASLSTCISQVLGFCILVVMTRREEIVSIRIRNFRPTLERYLDIARGGLPSLGRQGLASIAATVLNNCAGLYGEAAIAAFAVVNRIVMLGNSCILGLGQAFQPVCGFNYGARRYDRVKEAFHYTRKVMTIWATIFAIVVFLFAPQIVTWFRPGDPQVTEIGGSALRSQALVFPLMGVVVMASMILQNLRKTGPATLIAIARQGMFLIPALLIGVALGGLMGLIVAQPIADLASFALAVPLTAHILDELDAQQNAEPSSMQRMPEATATTPEHVRPNNLTHAA